jgi:hypothetical protein
MGERGSADWSWRRFLSGIGAGTAAFSLGRTGRAASRAHRAVEAPRILSGTRFDLSIGYRDANFTGRERIATAIDGSIPRARSTLEGR